LAFGLLEGVSSSGMQRRRELISFRLEACEAGMRRILACVDPAEPCDALLACARRLCEPDGELVLLHVGAPEPDFVGYGIGPESVRQAVARELRTEHRQVQDMAKKLADDGVSVTPLMVQGAVVEEILAHSARLMSDFIVLYSKRRGALHELIVGSVARGVVNGAVVPVVLVPMPQ
jgi:nucleotide-binding universal stress UspA family protein